MSAYDGPRHRYRWTVTFDFDDVDGLQSQWNGLDFRVAVSHSHGLGGHDEAIHLGSSASGSGMHWELSEVDPTMTAERFAAELDAWWKARRAGA